MQEEALDEAVKDVARELRCVQNCRIEIRISTRVIKTLKRPRRATMPMPSKAISCKKRSAIKSDRI